LAGLEEGPDIAGRKSLADRNQRHRFGRRAETAAGAFDPGPDGLETFGGIVLGHSLGHSLDRIRLFC